MKAVPLAAATSVLLGMTGQASAYPNAGTSNNGVSLHPPVLSVRATPDDLAPGGATAAVTARVNNATGCQLQFLSHQPYSVLYSHAPRACASSRATAPAALPNPADAPSTAALSLPPSVIKSSNWAGYATTGGPYTVVTGTFTVHRLAAGTPFYDRVAEWVGIDGSSSSDLSVIQAGCPSTATLWTTPVSMCSRGGKYSRPP